MGKTKSIRVDESLELELRRIQEKMKVQLGDIDLSQPQASIIAARILREKDTNISAEIIKARRGSRINSMTLL